ncbi:MAG: hypothetical protein EBZ24_15285, partial [Synechococcaceae bacterium WB9_4xB_025]|nr:hypothetical protein [Synechococcaceae bacterium WB9_4xB_025]
MVGRELAVDRLGGCFGVAFCSWPPPDAAAFVPWGWINKGGGIELVGDNEEVLEAVHGSALHGAAAAQCSHQISAHQLQGA